MAEEKEKELTDEQSAQVELFKLDLRELVDAHHHRRTMMLAAAAGMIVLMALVVRAKAAPEWCAACGQFH